MGQKEKRQWDERTLHKRSINNYDQTQQIMERREPYSGLPTELRRLRVRMAASKAASRRRRTRVDELGGPRFSLSCDLQFVSAQGAIGD